MSTVKPAKHRYIRDIMKNNNTPFFNILSWMLSLIFKLYNQCVNILFAYFFKDEYDCYYCSCPVCKMDSDYEKLGMVLDPTIKRNRELHVYNIQKYKNAEFFQKITGILNYLPTPPIKNNSRKYKN